MQSTLAATHRISRLRSTSRRQPSFIYSRNVLTYLFLATRTSIIIPTLVPGSTHNSRGRRIASKTVAHVKLHHLMDLYLNSFYGRLFLSFASFLDAFYICLSRIPYIMIIIPCTTKNRIPVDITAVIILKQNDRIWGDYYISLCPDQYDTSQPHNDALDRPSRIPVIVPRDFRCRRAK